MRFLLLAIFSVIASAQTDVRLLTPSEAAVLFADRHLAGQRIRIVLQSGEIAQGRLAGIDGGSIRRRGQADIPLSHIRSVAVTRDVTPGWRRGLGIAGGIISGSMLGGFVAFNLGVAGKEKAVLPIYIGSVITGGVAGGKIVRKQECIVYVLDHRAKREAD